MDHLDVPALRDGVERLPSHRRTRRRGPRSLAACVRRSQRFFAPSRSSGEVGADAADFCFSLSHSSESFAPVNSHVVPQSCLKACTINIRNIIAHKAELEARLAVLKPHIACIQETWLDDSVENVEIDGYTVVSRRDRTQTAKDGYGGVLILAREDIGNNVAELKKSLEDERTWCSVHTNIGPVLVGNWYRSQDDDAALSMPRCRAELTELMDDHVGCALLGDINVHYRRWLRFSNGNTWQGKMLYDVCTDLGLVQGVREPTRGEYLLDLVMTDMLDMAAIQVHPPIADHCVVCMTIDVETASADPVERFVWDYRRANWNDLCRALEDVNWKDVLEESSVNDAARRITDIILDTAKIHIPHRTARFTKRSHPWMTDRAVAAIRSKCEAYGTPEFEAASRRCREVIADEYRAHIRRLRNKISNLKKGSKQWWSLNRQLLNKTAKTSSIPPLRDSKGAWIVDPREKAQHLSDAFAAKCALPPPPDDPTFSVTEPAVELSGFLVIRSRWVRRILKAINPAKATGPDGLPGRILRACAKESAVPLAKFARRFLDEGTWPDIRRLHWIHPLYKKGAVSDSKNYRGVHLTSVLSKTLERIVSMVFVPFLDKGGAFGRSQWAFRPAHSCRDLVTLKFAQWIREIGRGKRIGLFLSDVSGAFDRVDSELLLRKCAVVGLGECVCSFLRAFLAPRRAVVLVQGQQSEESTIANQVYPGTVLGPPLWNVHFADVSGPATSEGFRETKFADDLSCDKVFDKRVSDGDILADLERCQSNVHQWGVDNRVCFDPAKEEMKILHTQRAHGDVFKFLGPRVDTKLVMDKEVQRIRGKTRPKVKAILRTRPFYTVSGLIGQYKAHVLPILEGSIGAIFHVSSTQIRKVDAVQSSFLHGLELLASNAFLTYNLAPLRLRRDVAIMGLFFKISHGKAHPDFEELFPRDSRVRAWTTRMNERRHDWQLVDVCDGNQSDLINRSIFGAVRVFNRLPAFLLEVDSVHAFQRLLTEKARHACRNDMPEWDRMYSNRNIVH